MKNKEDAEKCEKALSEWLELSMQVSFKEHFHFFKNKGFSHSQISTLHMLHHRRGCTVGHVSRMLSISNPAASQLLDQLVRQGYVERYEGRRDRRIRHHKLTEEGMSMFQESHYAKKSWFQSLIDSLSENELRITTEALEILNSKIKLFNDFNDRFKLGECE